MIHRILVAVDLADTEGAVPPAALSVAHLARSHADASGVARLIAEAVALAQTLDATLEIAYVRRRRARRGLDAPVNAGPDEVDDWIDRELSRLSETVVARGVSCMTTSLQGRVTRALARHVAKSEPDLVVLGGRKHWHVFPGRARDVLLHAKRPVLVIPSATAS